jgi:hypothetical protein
VILRPNAVDHRVDTLTTHDLLTHSAAQLVDPYRQAAAVRFVHWFFPGWLCSVLFVSIALAYFWQSGYAARVRDALRRRTSNEWIVRFAFGVALGLIVRLAGLLPNLYLYRVERAMGQSDQLLRGWSLDWLAMTIVWAIAIGIITAIVLWLVERTHQWYIYTILAIFAVNFGLMYLTPTVHPAPPYAFGPHEMQWIADRQLGFVAVGARWRDALTDALLLIFGAAFAVIIADRIGFRRDDDPVSRLALVAALCSVLFLAAVPIDNAVRRGVTYDEDRYAVALGADRVAAVRDIVRATDQTLREVCPGPAARFFLLRVESAGRRIHAINGVTSNC